MEDSMRHMKLQVLRTTAVVTLLFGAACSGPTEQAPPAAATSNVTVFEGARVITGDGSAPIENAVFVVEDGRFVSVGTAANVQAPAGANRVSLAGKTVMPAIVDTHVHLPVTSREALAEQLQRKAYYGVAAVASLGQDTGDVGYQMREEGVAGGAMFRTAGRGLTVPEPGRTEAPYWVTSEAEARKAVQELAARKVDIVKVWVDDRDGKFKKMGADLYRPIIDEAHKNSLRVIAHVFTLEDAKGLIKAGLDAFAHGVRDRDIDDEGVALFKGNANIVLAPNLPDRGVVTDMSWLSAHIPAGELTKLQEASTDRPAAQKTHGIQARNLAKLHAAGVKIALGTDGGIPWSHHHEMADMVAAGMTPSDVIVASTKNGAEFLRLDNGTVAAGKQADFIVLDANPLDDITNTRKIAQVYLKGAAVDRAAVKTRMNAAPAATN